MCAQVMHYPDLQQVACVPRHIQLEIGDECRGKRAHREKGREMRMKVWMEVQEGGGEAEGAGEGGEDGGGDEGGEGSQLKFYEFT